MEVYERRSIALVGFGVFVLSLPGSFFTSQQQKPDQPVFRSGVELVEVDAIALDAAGRPVTDLKKEEFRVFENGKERRIESFALVNLPIPPPHEPAALDVSTNASADNGRLFFLILDDVSAVQPRTETMKRVAHRLIEQLAPEDQVAVLWSSEDRRGAREFTTNHAAVLQAIDAFTARRATVARRAGDKEQVDLPDVEELERSRTYVYGLGGSEQGVSLSSMDLVREFLKRRPLLIVKDVCDYLASIPRRRKALVYIGPDPAGGLLDLSRGGLSEQDIEIIRAITAARRANVAFYAFDPTGHVPLGAEGFADEDAPLPLRDIARKRQEALTAFSEATGGFGSVERSGAAIDRVLIDTSTYYLLGYYADPPDSAAHRFLAQLGGDVWQGFRSIDVRTTRPGVRIRARKGYWAGDLDAPAAPPASKTVEQQVAASVRDLLPKSGLALRAFAAPFRGRKARAQKIAVGVEVSAPELSAGANPDGFADDAEVLVVAAEPGVKVRATDSVRAHLALNADRMRQWTSERYVIWTEIAVPPGHYQLRIGVHSSRANRAGSVYHDVEVPDFSKAPLSMSGIILERRSSVAARTPAARLNTIADLAPFPPAMDREFLTDDEVAAFVRLYCANKPSDVRITASIRALDSSKEVWQREQIRRAEEFVNREAADRVELSFDDLSPGNYRLHITATAGELTTARELDFRILSPEP